MKLNKAQVVEEARKTAYLQRDNFKLTADEIVAMDWKTRNAKARELALVAHESFLHTHATNYPGAFLEAYTDSVNAAWSNVVKNLDEARRRFKTACSGLTYEEAQTKICEIVESMKIRGGRLDGTTLRVERSWGIGGDVRVNFIRSDAVTKNPDDATQTVYHYSVTCEVSWSSTQHTVAEAAACVKLYAELVDVAAEVEAVMSRERVIRTYGIEVAPIAATQEG